MLTEGSVRVDLLGGTIDLEPLNFIIPHTVTLNVATSLKARVKITKTQEPGIRFRSLDYKTEQFFSKEDFTRSNEEKIKKFGPLYFVSLICNFFDLNSNLEFEISSGSPPGAGLGGSSAMGMTFFKALSELTGQQYEKKHAVQIVKAIEAQILECGPTGYQDYFPAVYGGVLALSPAYEGIKVEQLYDEKLKKVLESSLLLVYSGQTRLSGINNWEVYKGFFDGDSKIKEGLKKIANLSHLAKTAIEDELFEQLPNLIKEEGKTREALFPNIVTPEMRRVEKDCLQIDSTVGMKICGAGGGGCFLLVHSGTKRSELCTLIEKKGMKVLPFEIERPRDGTE